MKLVYVAGKFTGKGATEEEIRADVERNIARAVDLGVEVAALGAFPIIPHANTADRRFDKVQPYKFWIEGTKELLRRSDALITVDNWTDSSGARGEVAEMIDVIRRPVFYTLSELKEWLEATRHELRRLL